MPCVQPSLDEKPQRLLLEPGQRTVGPPQALTVGLHQRPRQYHVGGADGRRDRAAERAQVDHALPVHTLHGGNGPGGVAELAVVVVLDHIPAGRALRPADQLRAPPGGHGEAGGELVRRRDEREARAGRVQRRRVQTLPVQWDGVKLAARGAHRPVDAAVARVLQREGGVRIHDPDQKIQKVFYARAQHDLLRFALDAAVLTQKIS